MFVSEMLEMHREVLECIGDNQRVIGKRGKMWYIIAGLERKGHFPLSKDLDLSFLSILTMEQIIRSRVKSFLS